MVFMKVRLLKGRLYRLWVTITPYVIWAIVAKLLHLNEALHFASLMHHFRGICFIKNEAKFGLASLKYEAKFVFFPYQIFCLFS